ncbi:hypothetical protein ABZ135_18490 [Streptomyces sp. NPDC006339]|uniref:hypothetical protein n=1 Tax=Streptomyces sp. NPDC006339 TaxID=3156755 RepID=UPI0033BC85CA
MTITPVRKGTHRCDLPHPRWDPGWADRDLVRCDVCDRRYQLWAPEGWHEVWDYQWVRVGRLYAWWESRRKQDTPDPR